MLKVGWSVSSPSVVVEFLKHSVLGADACSGFETWFLAGQRIRMGRWRERLVLVQPSKEHRLRSGLLHVLKQSQSHVRVQHMMGGFSRLGEYEFQPIFSGCCRLGDFENLFR
jgi:hypothetical protein